MKNKKNNAAPSTQSVGQIGGAPANDDIEDTGFQKASADFYERRASMWTNFTRGDFWIAIGLYLILAGAAFVVL